MHTTELDHISTEADAKPELIDDLQTLIAPMLLNTDERDALLDRMGRRESRVANSALKCAARLQSMTEWSSEELLARLGCEVTVTNATDVSLDKLKSCDRFLQFVNDLVEMVDTRVDRRMAVLECSALLRETSQDVKGLDAAFRSGQFSPLSYLKLGEISRAARLIREQFGLLKPLDNPFANAPTIHISPERLAMFVRKDVEALGPNILENIASHLDGNCPGGCTAAERRIREAERLGV